MIYLDYAATCPKVKYPCSNYGSFFNVNANYAYKEKKLLKECENRVKTAIGAKDGEVTFGGTSSQLIENLMTNFSNIYKQNKTQFITLGSPMEHDSFDRYIAHYCTNLESLKDWLSYYNDIQAIVIWQGVNNLTGEVFPIEEIGKLCHKHNAFYICDTTAMIGHTPIPANTDQWCDCAIWSGHKIGTELGIGCMWVSDKVDKWLNGFSLHGTPNLAGACAITDATEAACNKDKLIQQDNKYWDLNNKLDLELDMANITHNFIPVVEIEEAGKPFALAISAIYLPKINADALQQYLASKSIYVGVGHSSCADDSDFRVLMDGYGLTQQEASEVIRISFGEDNSIDDIVALVKEIKKFKELYT